MPAAGRGPARPLPAPRPPSRRDGGFRAVGIGRTGTGPARTAEPRNTRAVSVGRSDGGLPDGRSASSALAQIVQRSAGPLPELSESHVRAHEHRRRPAACGGSSPPESARPPRRRPARLGRSVRPSCRVGSSAACDTAARAASAPGERAGSPRRAAARALPAERGRDRSFREVRGQRPGARRGWGSARDLTEPGSGAGCVYPDAGCRHAPHTATRCFRPRRVRDASPRPVPRPH